MSSAAPGLSLLRKSISESRLAHAYLFLGQDSEKSREIIYSCAQYLVCERPGEAACLRCLPCKKFETRSHPDVEYLDAKTDSVDDLREKLRTVFQHRPLEANYRVVVFESADEITDVSQDALLKVLEEPPPGSVWLLSAQSTASLNETVVSRCVPVRLQRRGSEGLVGPEMVQALELLLQNARPFEISRIVFGEKKMETSVRRERVRSWIESYLSRLQAWRREPSAPNLADSQWEKLFEMGFQGLRDIERQVNPELVLENVLLDWRRLFSASFPLRSLGSANTDNRVRRDQAFPMPRR